MKAPLFVSLSLITSLIHCAPSHALSSDRDQAAQIEADETEVDFRTGIRTLTNNVLVVQGTLRLKADKLVTTYNKQGDLIKAVANGSLARFKQRPDDQPDDVEGWAKKISVDYPNNTITLTGKAALKQGPSTATGNEIIYNMATDKLRILGNTTGYTPGKAGSTKPKGRIKDEFKDDAKAPPTTASQQTTGKPAEQTAEPVVPAKAGRSRLILKPKKKK